jgi:hypothetical protein
VTGPDRGRGYGPRECGSCRLWRPILEDERGPVGPCRLPVRTGDFPGPAPACERYLSVDQAVPASPPPERSRRRVARPSGPRVRGPERTSGSAPAGEEATVEPDQEPESGSGSFTGGLPQEVMEMTREEFVDAIREALRDEGPLVRLAPRWEGGTVTLKPGDPGTQPKEIPLDGLLHKIVLIRDRLRVLEQKINAHEKMTDAEKVDLQQYVTRCYGSLTTFNLLFRDERDLFVGEKSP